MMLRAVLLCAGLSLCVDAVTVSTKYGDVVGQSWTIHSGQTVNSFLAIPFAKPPVGSLRFAKSEEPESWDEPYVADTLGPACPQGGGVLLLTQIYWDRFNESCLHMNIYTPENMSGGPYPVMVWFHGGAYGGSANIQYPGYFLAARDVIVVVPNYRLGALGFVTTNDEIAPGNWGMWDQNLALRFVQENIGQFGGDPSMVTIFGQSAGASSTGIHVVSPESRDLFHQAIYESGSDMTLWALNYPLSEPGEYAKQLAGKLNCSVDEGSEAMVECLREKDADEVRRSQGVDCTPGWYCLGFSPVVDGEGGMLPRTPHEIRDDKQHAKVNIMAGQCNKDGSMYTVGFIPEAREGGFNRSTFEAIVRERLVDYFAPRLDNPRTVEDVKQAMMFHYTPWPHMDDTDENDQNRQAFNDMITDVGFGYPQDKINKQHMEENDVYYYIMSYRSPQVDDILPQWIGVPHNGELPYVWGWTLMKLNEHLRDETEMYVDIFDWDEKDAEYAEYIADLWTNFAKYGNPTPQPVPAPDGSDTTWPSYQEGSLRYLDIGATIDEKINYNQKSFAFWQTYIPYITGLDTFTALSDIMKGLQQDAEASLFTDEFIKSKVFEILQQKLKKD